MTTTFAYPTSMNNLQLLVGDTALPISDVSMQGSVDGTGVVWVVGVNFNNTLAAPADGVFNIPLPHGGAVSGMTMHIGDRVIVADIKERQQARIEYQEAKERGLSAALFEQQRAEMFTISVGNIQPSTSIRVEVTVHDSVAIDGTEASLRFPTMIKERFVPDVPDADVFDSPQVSTSGTTAVVQIDFAHDVEDLVCDTSANVRIGKSSLTSDAFALTGDLALRWSIPMKLASAKWVPDTSDSSMGTLEVSIRIPKTSNAPHRKKAIQIMVDRSGSMTHHYLEWARHVAAQVIAQLDSDDIIHVATFDSIIEALEATQFGFAPATRETKKKLNAELATVTARGGTQLTEALQAMGAVFGTLDDVDNSEHYERIAVLITDGAYGQEATAAFHRENELKGTRVIAVAIGENANGYLETLAANGVCVFIQSENTLHESTSKVLSRVAAPALRGVYVKCDGLTDVSPQFRPDVYPEVVKTMAGRMPRPTSDTTVAVMSADGFIMEMPVSVSDDSSATTRWAGNFIKSLDYQMMSQVDNEATAAALEKQIVDLSTTHKVLSKYTAWLAIDKESDAVQPILQTTTIPRANTLSGSMAPRLSFSSHAFSEKKLCMTTEQSVSDPMLTFSPTWYVEDPQFKDSISRLIAKISEIKKNEKKPDSPESPAVFEYRLKKPQDQDVLKGSTSTTRFRRLKRFSHFLTSLFMRRKKPQQRRR